MTISLRDVQTSDATPQRLAEERSFRTHDGVELFYRYWPASASRGEGAILLFHRGHEHGGRMAHLVDELGLPDFAFYAWDARGHGRRPASAATRRPSRRRCATCRPSSRISRRSMASIPQDMAIVAQSVGAVLIATWAHDYAPKVRALVLASPAFEVKLYVPFARPGLRLLQRLRGPFFVNSYVKAKLLTHDPGASPPSMPTR